MSSRRSRSPWVKRLNVDRFSVFQDRRNPNRWSVRWKRPDGTWHNRRTYYASTTEEALAQAPVVAGLEAPRDFGPEIGIVEAFQAAGKGVKGKRSVTDFWQYATKFCAWLEANHPNCRCWHQITRPMIREYLEALGHLKGNTIRLRTWPVRQTARFMVNEYGVRDVCAGIVIDRSDARDPEKVCLFDVVNFCDFLADRYPHLEPGVALQGLAALRMTEALRLTWDKIDIDRGLVEISGEVKNRSSRRLIPLAGRVVEALRRCRALGKIVAVQDHVIVNKTGEVYADRTKYSRAVREARQKWNPRIRWAPGELRNGLVQLSNELGIRSALWGQYEGRAPQSIAARHYLGPLTNWTLEPASEGKRIDQERDMAILRRQVVEFVNRAAAGEQPERAHFFNFFQLLGLPAPDGACSKGPECGYNAYSFRPEGEPAARGRARAGT